MRGALGWTSPSGRQGLCSGRRGGRRKTAETVTTWAATTNQVLALREHLLAEGVTVWMEATGEYWKPVYYLLEDAGVELLLSTPGT